MPLKRGHHCVYNTHYHIVFPVKYRKALLNEPIVKYFREIVLAITERYELDLEELGCDLNHIHLLCSFHPKYSISEMVRVFKSITARELFKKFPELKQELWGGAFWSDGYYAATIGERGSFKTLEQYIKNQGQKLNEAQLQLI